MSTIRYKLVHNDLPVPHWATCREYAALDLYAKAFFAGKTPKCHHSFFHFIEDLSLSASNKAIIAYTEKEVVGVFRFDVDKREPTIYACGTWVRASHRRQGIATQMWKRAIAKRKEVSVCTASRAGASFVGQFQKRHAPAGLSVLHSENW